MSQHKKPTPPSSGSGGAPPGSATAECPCPTKVVFSEETDLLSNATDKYKYGWDNLTNAAVPWKSVEKGQNDIVKAEITPAACATRAEFKSDNEPKATVSPKTAASAKQDLTVTGVEKGEAEVKATCEGSELGKFKVAVYAKKTKTVAIRLVHEKNYTSTDVTDASIKEALRKIYKQAVLEFTVTRLPAKTVEFDKNGDGKVDVDSWMSEEMRIIRDACKDDSYDYNIFLVDKPSDGSTGFMDYNQRYGFIHADNSSNGATTLAHELGHGQGLEHHAETENVMLKTSSATKWLLDKAQWDKLNP